MANSTQDSIRSIGFCTVRSHAEHGFFGGYLVLNSHARPLEFHCTLPVKPSRAQAILYGSTLADFVCGEQIAKALVSKAKITPAIVLTDCLPVLALGHVSDQLVAWVDTSRKGETKPVAAAAAMVPQSESVALKLLRLGDYNCGIAQDRTDLEPQLRDTWDKLGLSIDLTEPFERIEEALFEAHPVMKAA
jgi:hypothetical protein